MSDDEAPRTAGTDEDVSLPKATVAKLIAGQLALLHLVPLTSRRLARTPS